MRYFTRTILGLGLMIASIVAVSYAINQLLSIGTCASGGPYVSARPCPPGTERIGLAIPVAIFALLLGAFLYSGRGSAPGSERPSEPGIALGVIWAGLFLGIGFGCLWGVWGPDANPGPGGKTGGLIVGFLFIPMGLGGVLPMISAGKTMRAASAASPIGVGQALKLARGARRVDFSDLVEKMQAQGTEKRAAGDASAEASDPFGADIVASPAGDVVSKLERLERLRQSGAIDAQEFERLKRAVMAQGGA